MSVLAQKLIDPQGFVNPRTVADEFHTTIKEVAQLAGLSVDAVSKKDRVHSKSSQKRLRDLVMIINRVTPWCGTPFQAFAWYRSEGIPSFGDLTAEALVKQGHADLVMQYIDRIAEGGFA
ncbi:MAG: XRE family transcriptional regulator [gamma proteobacterium endosymbiont of Lamellibrachia anaximandri]|nr:XRE family transcriptional regulator [gamma proteobacterium endosymbiont of Lamellibrachia anaximandri]